MSDQDFFFDDDDKADAPKKGGKVSAPAKKAPAKKAAASAKKNTVPAPVGATMVTVPVTALIAVVALLLGVIVGFVIAPKTPASPAVTSTPNSASMDGSGSGTAPELSEEEMQQGMPAGHPDVSGGSGGATPTE